MSFSPQYRQIEHALRARIATLHPGARMPSDSELCAEFGVSRMTARSAMQRLVDDGLIARLPGRGTFVAEPPTHRQANRLMTFTQEMLRSGRIPSSRVLTRVIRPSSPQEAADLDIVPRQPIVHVRRLRMADGAPVAIESAVLIGAAAQAVMAADLAHGSLHESLRRAGLMPRRGTATIGAEAATAEDARLLATRNGEALLVERRVIVDGQGRRVEATESRYRADRYALLVRFDVDPPDPADRAEPDERNLDGAGGGAS
jgi:GntR family transcriptional regulator